MNYKKILKYAYLVNYTFYFYCAKKYNQRRRGHTGRGSIPGPIDIARRPAIVEDKQGIGDWGKSIPLLGKSISRSKAGSN